MGEGTRAVGKLVISLIAAAIIGASVYNSFNAFHLGQFVGFPYAAEIIAFLSGLVTLALVYVLLMSLKYHL